MKTISRLIAIACLLAAGNAYAQNWTTISASNITDLNQKKLAAGQLCFLITDQNDNPISVGIGGGGQSLKRGYCSPVANGAVTAFTVPNPATTLPSGIYYRVTAKDTSTGLEVLRYTQVTFSGTSFSFDAYMPNIPGASYAPLTGNNVSGNLAVSGNANITGTLTAGSFSPTVITSGQFTSNTANPAASGIIRLATGDQICFRNNANTGDVCISKSTVDALVWNGTGGLTLQQSTAATSGANQSSNNLSVQGNYWNGTASAVDSWTWQNVLGTGTNPTSTYTLTHSGSPGTPSVSIPFAISTPSIQGPGFHQQIFTSSGTFTIPTGITQVKVTVIGGGGAGGGGTSATAPGGGGGGGGAAIKWLTGLTPGNTIGVTVGAGGAGVAGGAGNAGGNSSIQSGTQTISTVTANGGNGGLQGSSFQGGPQPGGSASGGDLNFTGGSGGGGVPSAWSGNGGNSIYGSGGTGQDSGVTGVAGSIPGGGGSGGGPSAGGTAGGAGANGIVIFEWVS